MKRFVCSLFFCLAFQGAVFSQEKDAAKPAIFPVFINGKRAFINKEGKVVITPEEVTAKADETEFTEGLATVEISGAWGYMNEKGKIVIKPKFATAWDFYRGYAAVGVAEKKIVTRGDDGNEEVRYEGIKYGFIDKSGKMVVKPQYDDFWGFDDEGMGQVKVNGKHGFVDYTGKLVIKPQFSSVSWFSDGLAYVVVNDEVGSAYIDKTGKIVSDPRYKHYGDRFYEGLVSAFDGKKYGYLDKNWNVVIPFQFDMAGEFSEGLAAVKVGDKWGFIDKTGQVVIPLIFDEQPVAFSDGMAVILVNKRFGYIDHTGRVVIPPQFLSARKFHNGLAAAISGDRIGEFQDFWANRRRTEYSWDYIDKTGKYVWRSQ